MTAQEWADLEGVAHIRLRAGTRLRGVVVPVNYCVRAREAKPWELLAGELVLPRGGERIRESLVLRGDELEWLRRQFGKAAGRGR